MNNNSNGHTKAFESVPPKSAEEIALETTRKIAPEIRRGVRSMKIPAQAKFLFDAILDDTFMFEFGGDGHGRLIASVRDLAKRYRHDKDSIIKWATVLRDKEVLWFERCWPFQEWRVTALCAAPDHRASMIQKIKARASARRHQANKAEGIGVADFSSKNGQSPSKSEGVGVSDGQKPPNKAEGIGASVGRYRSNAPKGSDTNRGKVRSNAPKGSDVSSDTSRSNAPKEGDKDSELEGALAQLHAAITGKKSSGEKSPDVRQESLEPVRNVQRHNAFKKGGENAFLVRVAEVMTRYSPKFAANELKNSGAWWRMKFRQDEDKACRVLAETERAIKEGETFSENPGAYAVDLWKRFA